MNLQRTTYSVADGIHDVTSEVLRQLAARSVHPSEAKVIQELQSKLQGERDDANAQMEVMVAVWRQFDLQGIRFKH
jgi:hypothetical protein